MTWGECGEGLGQKNKLRDRPRGDNWDRITQRLLLDANECGFQAENHKEAHMDKINEHHNFRRIRTRAQPHI